MGPRWRSLRKGFVSGCVLLVVGCGPLLLSACRTVPPPNSCQSTGDSPRVTMYNLTVSSLVESAGMVYALIDTLTSGFPNSGQVVSARLYALRASDGTLLWQQPADIETDLLADQDTLYLSSRYALEARRASDGTLLWRGPGGSTSYGSRAHPVLDQGILYTSSVDRLFAIGANDGQMIWQAAPGPTNTLGIPSLSPYSPLVVRDGMVFVGLLDGPVTALRASDGTVLWQTTVVPPATETNNLLEPLPTTSQPIAEAFRQVYVSAGQGVQVLRASDGHLEGTLPGLSTGRFAPATVVGGVLYTTSGQMAYAVQVPENTVLWHTPLPSSLLAAPMVVQGFVYFPGASTLLRTTDGSPLQPSTPGRPLAALGPSGGYQAMSGFLNDCSPNEDQPVTISALHEPDQRYLWSIALPIG